MKLFARIICIAILSISTSAFADATFTGLNSNVFFGTNNGAGDNITVSLWGPGVSLFAQGGTPGDFFYSQYPQGSEVFINGEGYIWWDLESMGIVGTDCCQDFVLDPTFPGIPEITLPTNGQNFSYTYVWEPIISGTIDDWVLGPDGTYVPDCPATGCNFVLVGKPIDLTFNFTYYPDNGGWYKAQEADFITTPEPGTLALVATGIGAIVWRRFRYRNKPLHS